MKRKIKPLDVAIVFMLIVTGVLVYNKVINKSASGTPFRMNNTQGMTVRDVSGDTLKWASLLPETGDCWFLILEMSNCNTCIYKGIDDLKALQAAGKPCFVIVVHDIVDEVAGWSGTIAFTPFYMLNRVDYYEHVSSMILPALVRVNGNEIRNFRYITL